MVRKLYRLKFLQLSEFFLKVIPNEANKVNLFAFLPRGSFSAMGSAVRKTQKHDIISTSDLSTRHEVYGDLFSKEPFG